MLVLNKYLRELGINEESWPFNEIAENTKNKSVGKHYDDRYIEKDGFINAESFSMDYTLALIIYSYLCYFRDNCINFGYPAYFELKNGKDKGGEYGHKKWKKTVDDMILGFKMFIEFEDKAPSILDYPNRAGFTQSQLGDLIGTNKAQISRYEHNKTIPDTKTIFKILVALQISPNELLLKDY